MSSPRGARQIFALQSKCDSHQDGGDGSDPPLGMLGERIRIAILPYAPMNNQDRLCGIRRWYKPLSICPRSILQKTTVHNKIETPFRWSVTISDIILFRVKLPRLYRNNTSHVHVVRELEHGCLEKPPVNCVLPLRRVRPNGSLDIHALCTPGARAKCSRRSRDGLLFEHLRCGTKAIT
jgi:hypothetical protein